MKKYNSKKNIWLMGGFGNVLFQILAFNVLTKNNNSIFFVNTLTKKNTITKFIGWTIHESLYDNLIDEKKIQAMGFFKSLIIIITGFISKKLNLKFKLSTFYSSKVKIDEKLCNNIFGYFQHSEFLKKNQDELLQFGNRLRLKYALKQKHPIVVHYRKGDSGWALENSYYYDEIKKMLSEEVLPILIVTDSLEDAKHFFSEVQNISILSSKNALEDFKHLISTEKLYCAPSTFSWWAAHSVSSDSEVIIPKYFQENLGIFIKSNRLKII
jgi:hypothetical protein